VRGREARCLPAAVSEPAGAKTMSLCAECPLREPLRPRPVETVAPADQTSLLDAAGVVIRHWELLGPRGFDAAITLLRRVAEREGKSG
jgi:hypothetical protein